MVVIWKLVAEISVQPEDVPSGLTKGFMHVLTWADSAESAERKLSDYFKRFDWHVISSEDARIIHDDEEFECDEMQDMLERTKANLNAIMLGTFHSYKPN
jgi:hypothetical protein